MKIKITDDGDEVVNFYIENDWNQLTFIGKADHETYGWAGMTDVIGLVENLAAAFDIDVENVQDIV